MYKTIYETSSDIPGLGGLFSRVGQSEQEKDISEIKPYVTMAGLT